MKLYGIVLQVSPRAHFRVRKCLRDCTEQIPDHVNLPQPPANKRVPKAVLARVRRIIANTIFELVLDNKLQLRTVDSGKVDLTVPRGMWTRHVFPTVLERLQKDSFEGGSIADQVIKRCSTYRTTHDVLRSWWGRWPARHSMSWEEWSSSASPRQWVRDDVTIDPINGTRIGRQETVTDIASYDTNRGHYVERREILGTCATKIDTDLSIRVSAWLSASVPRRTSDTGRSQHNATLARCRITKGHLATETYTFKLHDSDSKVSQEKVHDMHRPGSYGTNERLKAAQDLSRGGVKFGLTDSIPKHVHEQIEEHSVQSISRLTYCGLCSHMGQECDGERLCGQCVRKSTSCREQGQPLASSQDLKTKCYACFKQGQRCCGSRPCGFCAKHHKRCRDQGENEKTTPRAQIEFLEITQQPAAAQHFRHLQSIPWGLLHQWHRLQQRHGPLWESETWIVVCTVESSYKKRASSRPTAIALPLTGRRSKSLIRLQLASSIQLSHTSTR